jgi:hypothetical protein
MTDFKLAFRSLQYASRDLPLTTANLNDDDVRRLRICRLRISVHNWHWFPLCWDGEDLCYGLVLGWEREYGPFNLSEIARFGIHAIEININFQATIHDLEEATTVLITHMNFVREVCDMF